MHFLQGERNTRKKLLNTVLDFRYLAAKERERGDYGKGPKPFTREDRHNFSSFVM